MPTTSYALRRSPMGGQAGQQPVCVAPGQQFHFIQLESGPSSNGGTPHSQQQGPSTSSSSSSFQGQKLQTMMAFCGQGQPQGQQMPANHVDGHEQQQVYQLVQIPADTELFGMDSSAMANGTKMMGHPQQQQQQFVLQLPEGVQLATAAGTQFLDHSGSPGQLMVLNLSDGTAAFIPIGAAPGTSFQLATSQMNGQPIELVSAEHFDEVQAGQFVTDGEEHPEIGTDLADFSQPGSSQMEPVYVNEKQYARILKRRASRAKLEMEGRIPKQRRKYLHESRHKHAQNRARREGGKFDSGAQLRADSSASQRGQSCLGTGTDEEGGADDSSAASTKSTTPTPQSGLGRRR